MNKKAEKQELKTYVTNQDGFSGGKHRKKDTPLDPMTAMQADHDLMGGTIRLEGEPNPHDVTAKKEAATAKSGSKPKTAKA
ncbi:MAG: hypothetical protein HRU28_03225 [Rhizobiales bacterium]|nr:hypothetical protein [Hyphomicrobiales bacterium]